MRQTADVVLFRNSHGGGGMYLEGDRDHQLAMLKLAFNTEMLAETEWVIVPDTTLRAAHWPE